MVNAMRDPMARTVLRPTPEQLALIEEAARRLGVTRARFIRDAATTAAQAVLLRQAADRMRLRDARRAVRSPPNP